jgi:Ricin-type beta-trefoil lectin domain
VRIRGLIAAGVLVATVIGTLIPASAASAANSYGFRNLNSLLCMAARAGSGERPVVQTTCDFTVPAYWADQHWSLPGGFLQRTQIKNVALGLCLVARGSGETAVVATGCGPYGDQYWYAMWDANTATYQYLNGNSGLCLAARGSGESRVIVTTCDYAVGQFWRDQHWYSTA